MELLIFSLSKQICGQNQSRFNSLREENCRFSGSQCHPDRLLSILCVCINALMDACVCVFLCRSWNICKKWKSFSSFPQRAQWGMPRVSKSGPFSRPNGAPSPQPSVTALRATASDDRSEINRCHGNHEQHIWLSIIINIPGTIGWFLKIPHTFFHTGPKMEHREISNFQRSSNKLMWVNC